MDRWARRDAPIIKSPLSISPHYYSLFKRRLGWPTAPWGPASWDLQAFSPARALQKIKPE